MMRVVYKYDIFTYIYVRTVYYFVNLYNIFLIHRSKSFVFASRLRKSFVEDLQAYSVSI